MSARPAISALVRGARHPRRTGRTAPGGPAVIPTEALVVGTIAPLRKDARYDVWVDVAHAVCDAHPTVHFIAIGAGPLDGEVRGRIRRTGHHRRIHVVAPDDRPRHDRRGFDLYLQVGTGGSTDPILDALAAGIPVISAATAPARELVRHNGEGLLVAPGDRAAFVSVIESLLDDPDRRARLGRAARSRAATARP